jgi:hypothetical protein
MGRRVVDAMLKPVDIQIGPVHIKGRAVVVVPMVFGIIGAAGFIVMQIIRNPAIIGQIADIFTR